MRKIIAWIVGVIIVLIILLVARSAAAANIDEPAIRNIVGQINGVMNSHDQLTVKNFFQFYIDQDAKFIIDSEIVDVSDANVLSTDKKINIENAQNTPVTGTQIQDQAAAVENSRADNNRDRKEVVTFNKNDYIKYIMDDLSSYYRYIYIADIISFSIAADSQSAVVTLHIDESAIRKVYLSGQDRNKKMLASTNCNINLSASGSGAIISGSNCIEKLAFQYLK